MNLSRSRDQEAGGIGAVNFTASASVKFAPSITTRVPGSPKAGAKSVMIGPGPVTTKTFVLEPVPAALTMLMGPVVALGGTVA